MRTTNRISPRQCDVFLVYRSLWGQRTEFHQDNVMYFSCTVRYEDNEQNFTKTMWCISRVPFVMRTTNRISPRQCDVFLVYRSLWGQRTEFHQDNVMYFSCTVRYENNEQNFTKTMWCISRVPFVMRTTNRISPRQCAVFLVYRSLWGQRTEFHQDNVLYFSCTVRYENNEQNFTKTMCCISRVPFVMRTTNRISPRQCAVFLVYRSLWGQRTEFHQDNVMYFSCTVRYEDNEQNFTKTMWCISRVPFVMRTTNRIFTKTMCCISRVPFVMRTTNRISPRQCDVFLVYRSLWGQRTEFHQDNVLYFSCTVRYEDNEQNFTKTMCCISRVPFVMRTTNRISPRQCAVFLVYRSLWGQRTEFYQDNVMYFSCTVRYEDNEQNFTKTMWCISRVPFVMRTTNRISPRQCDVFLVYRSLWGTTNRISPRQCDVFLAYRSLWEQRTEFHQDNVMYFSCTVRYEDNEQNFTKTMWCISRVPFVMRTTNRISPRQCDVFLVYRSLWGQRTEFHQDNVLYFSCTVRYEDNEQNFTKDNVMYFSCTVRYEDNEQNFTKTMCCISRVPFVMRTTNRILPRQCDVFLVYRSLWGQRTEFHQDNVMYFSCTVRYEDNEQNFTKTMWCISRVPFVMRTTNRISPRQCDVFLAYRSLWEQRTEFHQDSVMYFSRTVRYENNEQNFTKTMWCISRVPFVMRTIEQNFTKTMWCISRVPFVMRTTNRISPRQCDVFLVYRSLWGQRTEFHQDNVMYFSCTVRYEDNEQNFTKTMWCISRVPFVMRTTNRISPRQCDFCAHFYAILIRYPYIIFSSRIRIRFLFCFFVFCFVSRKILFRIRNRLHYFKTTFLIWPRLLPLVVGGGGGVREREREREKGRGGGGGGNAVSLEHEGYAKVGCNFACADIIVNKT